ncbi:MAG TPA: transcriptional repressor [Candidatus Polarisedimenticolia bacterium]|nr:transcriptional repressor [Candidatus Polarisedimenticolia bacterium]
MDRKAGAERARQAVDGFVRVCRAKGLSVTHQRLAIYEAVVQSRTHPGAEEIFGAVRGRFPTISRGTVYRTLETLCSMGLVTDVSRARGTARFEAVLEPHHHLVCLGCRRIIDLHDPSLDEVVRRASPSRGGRRGRSGGEDEGAAGFEITGYQVQFVGYCKDCRSRRAAAGSGNAHRNREERHGTRA